MSSRCFFAPTKNYSDLPPHLALEHDASDDITKMFVDASRESISNRGYCGKLPIDLYKGSNSEIRNLSTQNELLNLCVQAFDNENQNAFNNIPHWLENNENNSEKLYKAINYKNTFNRSPLHFLAVSKPPFYLMESFIKLAPEATKLKDHQGRLLLHYASMSAISANLMNLMIDAYPDSITVKDNDDKLPPKYASHNSLLENLLRRANFPEPS
jgi:hypothetical protein